MKTNIKCNVASIPLKQVENDIKVNLSKTNHGEHWRVQEVAELPRFRFRCAIRRPSPVQFTPDSRVGWLVRENR